MKKNYWQNGDSSQAIYFSSVFHLIRVGNEPRFSIRTLSRVKRWKESDWGIEGFRAIPEAFHPLSMVHGDSKLEYACSVLRGDEAARGE